MPQEKRYLKKTESYLFFKMKMDRGRLTDTCSINWPVIIVINY